MISINFEPLKQQVRDQFYNSKLNLDIAEKEHKRSYFNLDDNYFFIEILISSKNFQFKKLYYFEINEKQYLLVHISDKTNVAVRPLISNFLMQIKNGFKSVENCEPKPISIDKKSEITVFVYNENIFELNCDKAKIILINLINNEIKKENKSISLPDESSGGGVITKFP